MTELIIVSGEPLWPSGEGGGIRAAGLVEALARRFSVRVLAPAGGSPPDGVALGVDPLPEEEPVSRVVALASPHSRLGRALLGPRRSRALLQAVADHRPRALLFAGGHLAAAAPTIDRPTFVDFPDLAVRRGPTSSALDALKARWWEPVEARRAVVASAATPDDVALLASWGARAVLVPPATAASTWAEACIPLADAVEQAVRAAATRG